MYRIIKETIAEIFVNDLKKGILRELLVELANDATLMLDFRNNYMNVYYRGGMISKLEYKMTMKCYKDTFNDNYIKAYNSIKGVEDSEMYHLKDQL